ncbi:MAG: hypothetical protein IKW33_04730 [Clostridia bacterium]|nr:hypothetical protein [Clostridia bacterium]
MSNELLLTISIMVAFIASTIKKVYANSFSGGAKELNFCNTLICFFAIILFLCYGGFGSASTFTILLAIVFGVVTGMQYLLTFKAISLGSWAYTTIISSLSTLIPTTSGWIFWGEPVSIFQIFGIIFLVGCFMFSTDLSSKENKKLSLTWLIYATLGGFICTGLIGVLQKVHQTSAFGEERNAFLIISFIISLLFSFTFFIVALLKEKKLNVKNIENNLKFNGKELFSTKKYNSLLWIILIAVCGVSNALNNKFNLFLSGVFPTAFFFPMTSGTSLLLTTIFSVIIFKDKLKPKQWIGFALGVVAFAFFCLSKIF